MEKHKEIPIFTKEDVKNEKNWIEQYWFPLSIYEEESGVYLFPHANEISIVPTGTIDTDGTKTVLPHRTRTLQSFEWKVIREDRLWNEKIIERLLSFLENRSFEPISMRIEEFKEKVKQSSFEWVYTVQQLEMLVSHFEVIAVPKKEYIQSVIVLEFLDGYALVDVLEWKEETKETWDHILQDMHILDDSYRDYIEKIIQTLENRNAYYVSLEHAYHSFFEKTP